MSDVMQNTAPVAEPKTEEKKEESKDPSQVVADALSSFAGAPTRDQIEAWKRQHGEIFCSGFSETELYIWRPLNRMEFVNLQTQLSRSERPVSQLETEGMVVEQCMLWASEPGRRSIQLKAGSTSSLHEQIMANSNFMNPQLANALVIKL